MRKIGYAWSVLERDTGGDPSAGRARDACLVVGALTRDRIIHPQGAEWRIGGVAWYGAAALARLGTAVRVVTRMAPRDAAAASALEARGIAPLVRPARKTTLFVNRYDARNRLVRQRLLRQSGPIDWPEVSPALPGCDLVYLGPLHRHDLSPALLARLQGQAIALALDIQGLVRVVRAGEVHSGPAPALLPLMARAQALKASAAEACALTGCAEPAAALRWLAARHPRQEVLITCGGAGALLAADGAVHRIAAPPRRLAEPTGAGDIFFGAYLARRRQGAPPAAAAAFAAEYAGECLAARVFAHALPLC